jgi:hypothetical protein
VLRPETTIKLSLRLPPTINSKEALEDFQKILLENPPYGSQVTLSNLRHADGWNANKNEPYFDQAIINASKVFYGRDALGCGEVKLKL